MTDRQTDGWTDIVAYRVAQDATKHVVSTCNFSDPNSVRPLKPVTKRKMIQHHMMKLYALLVCDFAILAPITAYICTKNLLKILLKFVKIC